jgi:hypothetical protein
MGRHDGLHSVMSCFSSISRTIEADGMRGSVPDDLHADDVRHFTLVLDVKIAIAREL